MCYMEIRSAVGVRELRQNLSVYLARVRRGETFTVTERRHVVAVLAPAARSSDAVDRLVAEGRAVAARREPTALPRALGIALDTPLSQLVRETGEDQI